MHKFKIISILFIALFSNSLKAQYLTGPNGVKYFFWRSFGATQRAQIGDLVFVNMVAKSSDDSVILSSYVQGQPFQVFVPKPTYKGCFFEVFTLIGERDSVEVQVDADSLFMKSFATQRPEFVKQGSKVKILIKLQAIVTKAEYEKRKKQEAEDAEDIQRQAINKYIADNNLQMTKTASGLYYQYMLKGQTRHVKAGDQVSVHYKGYLLDGKVFDSSIPRNQPFEFTVGSGMVIKGWDEALMLMDIGDKLKVIIPYQLAYGERGSPPTIPEFSPLVFEIELLNIK
jgi:FKBP-type peptidyl-prolyl cis-trans isomerase FkpA